MKLYRHGWFLDGVYKSVEVKWSNDGGFRVHPKMDILKNSLEPFFRNRPIVSVFYDFCNKLTVFSAFFSQSIQSFAPW
jgi:hypothetical protein